MTPKKPKRKPGPPARYGYRPTLTIRLTKPVYETIKAAAGEHGKSLSEEIEDRLSLIGNLEAAERRFGAMRERANAMVASARIQALRLAGLLILRELDGRATRVVVDLETLLADADGIQRGLRSGFIGEPVPEPQSMTPEQQERLPAEIESLRRQLAAATARPGEAA